jgi:hypothetical protein
MSGLSSVFATEVNAVIFVGGSLPSLTGSDIGAEINYAYANLLPSTGGIIYVLPQTPGANGSQPYAWTTAISFNTPGKYVNLRGAAPATQLPGGILAGNTSFGGATLNWTGTTGQSNFNYTLTGVTGPSSGVGVAVYAGTFAGGGSNALAGKTFQVKGFTTHSSNNGYFVCTASTTTTLTLANGLAVSESGGSYTAQACTVAMAWTNDVAGDGNAVSNAIEDLCLINDFAGGLNNGGNSYCTVGLDFSGAGRMQTMNVRIGGFGVGKQCVNPSNWGATDFQHSIVWNNVGFIMHDGMETYGWFGGALEVNSIGMQISGTLVDEADINFNKVSIDSNTVFGVVGYPGQSCQVNFTDCHFENLLGSNTGVTTHYVNLMSSSTSAQASVLTIKGGSAFDDMVSNSTPEDYWFSCGQGSGTFLAYMNVMGLTIYSSGRTATQVFQVGGQGAYLQGYNTNITNLPVIAGGTSAGKAINLFTPNSATGNPANTMFSGKYNVAGNPPTVAGTGYGSGGSALISVGTGGTDSAFIINLKTGTAGTASNGSVTVTFNTPFLTANNPIFVATLLNNNGVWNARATVIANSVSLSSIVLVWDNNSINLAFSVLFQIAVVCVGS